MQFGYTAMCEQAPVKQLVRDLQASEEAGFDFSVISDHYFPWLEKQGHSGYTWAVLGAAAQATDRLPLMIMVTCPTFRYHPAVVAQKAATVGVLSDGRFTLGLVAGENLNEHVIGTGWPAVGVRHKRLEEAAQIIRALFTGGYVSFSGCHFEVERAKLYDLPDSPVPIGIAVSGEESVELAAKYADCMITTEPDGSLVSGFEESGGTGKPKYGQMAICYDPDETTARDRARPAVAVARQRRVERHVRATRSPGVRGRLQPDQRGRGYRARTVQARHRPARGRGPEVHRSRLHPPSPPPGGQRPAGPVHLPGRARTAAGLAEAGVACRCPAEAAQGMTTGDQATGAPSPDALIPALDDRQLSALREVGRERDQVSYDPDAWRGALPLGPELGRYPAVAEIQPTTFGRLVPLAGRDGQLSVKPRLSHRRWS
jgi:G6PDH family F420-dependent oxidoreductase